MHNQNSPILETCLSPSLLNLYDLEDTIVIVIDIFRATTTMSVAFANGASKIYPFLNVDDCKEFKKANPEIISAGERNGKLLEGMDKGNSPADFPTEVISGKVLGLTTTNGTKILHMSFNKNAKEIIVGAFVNINNVIDYLKKQNKKVLLACAGWKDKVNMEDTLFAGAVAYALKDSFQIDCDASKIAMQYWKSTDYGKNLYNALKSSNHYNRLHKLGAGEDIITCTSLNTHPCLAIFNKEGYLSNML